MIFYQNQSIDISKLNYIKKPKKKVYANLYEIILNKPLKLYQYPYSVVPEIEGGDIRIRDKLFKACSKKLKEKYGECFISGDSLYAKNKIEDIHDINCDLFLNGINNYTLQIQKVKKEKVINQNDIHKDPLAKQFIELLIKDILHSNPNLEFYKGLFVLTNKKQKIETDNVCVYFYPGFTTSFIETDSGNYLNVTLKNKIIQNDTVLDYLVNMDYTNKKNHENIRKQLKGRSFKVSYMKKNHIIDDILFDRNPKTQKFNYDGKNINLYEYYLSVHGIEIQEKTQPLILVRKKGPQGEVNNLYFIPELCSLSGLEDHEVKDGFFMKALAKKTKLEPNDRIMKTDEFLELLKNPEREIPKSNNNENKSKIIQEIKLSAKEKSELYGIEVKPLKKLFTAYCMKDTNLVAGNNKKVTSTDRQFPVL